MELWNKLHHYLSTSFEDNFSKPLLKRIYFKECVNDSIISLTAEDAFTQGWFEANCMPLLKNYLHDHSFHYQIRMEIASTPSITTPEILKSYQHQTISLNNNTKLKPFNPYPQQLSLDFLFNHYIPGTCNEFPFQAAQKIVHDTNSRYNPFILAGSSAVGKTHLAQAIVHAYINQHPTKIALYTTSENFTNEFVTHIQKNTMDEFRDKYRNCDLLVIDDIQDFKGREKTILELSNIFDALISRGSQMVFTSDRPIKKLKDFDARLRTRLNSGLYVDLKQPSIETRKAILLDMALRENHKLDFKIIDLIAETIEDTRELLSSLIKLFAYADLKKQDISLRLAKEILSDKITIDIPSNLSIPEIQKSVASYFGIKASDIRSASKLNSIAHPRQVSMYIASKYTKMTSTEIGRLFNKSHSTVIRSVQKIENEYPKNANLRKDIDKLLLELAEHH